MKTLIALAAAIILLMTFPLQYALEQYNHHNITQFQKIINNAKEEAKQKGYFTPEIIAEMKGNISAQFKNINQSEIIVNVTTTPKYRTNSFDERELIYYEVGVPIKKLISCNSFWGISDIDNEITYYVKNYTSSELVAEP